MDCKSAVCESCGESFPSRTKLFKHLNLMHGMESNSPKLYKIVVVFGWQQAEAATTGDKWSKEDALCSTIALDNIETLLITAINVVDKVEMSALERPKGYCRSSKSTNLSANLVGVDGSSHACFDVISYHGKTPYPYTDSTWVDAVNDQLPPHVRVFRRETMPALMSEFSAEAMTTQRVFEFIVPLNVIMPPELVSTLDSGGELPSKRFKSKKSQQDSEMERLFPRDTEEGMARVKYFRKIKNIMRHFGEGGRKSFHNFAEAHVLPDDTAAKRRLDRFFHKELQTVISPITQREETWVVFSISGDDFLKGQIRRMFSMIIAVLHEWFSEDLLCELFESDVIVDVPAFPSIGLYLSEIKFAMWESKNDGRYIVPREKSTNTPEEVKIVETMEHWRQAVQRAAITSYGDVSKLDWETNLKAECQRLTSQVLQLRNFRHRNLSALFEKTFHTIPDTPKRHVDTPEVYERVLHLLREADRSGKWPLTSTGRKQVIEERTLTEKGGRGGSFSVGCLPKHLAQPKGNHLFPELTRACFDLERALRPDRKPSGTIAINRNAQFKAHRDSGAGNGQSISLIVALGDFVGGEIVCEGTAHDIRYNPIEFDGWNERHWTLPFEGERFSLVWFTPLGVTDDDMWWWKGGSAPVVHDSDEGDDSSKAYF